MTFPANKPVIIAVGLYVPGTGFTRVFKELFNRLACHYSIHWLGIAYRGYITTTAHYTLYPSNLAGGDMYGAEEAATMALELKAAAIWLLNDMYMLKNYRDAWQPLKEKNIQLIAYVPLDGDITDETTIANSLFFDKLVLYTQWAEEEVSNAIKKYTQNKSVTSIPALSHIYHGVDASFFTPATIPGKAALKESIFEVAGADRAIFLLNANRYSERKDIDTTLLAFSKALSFLKKPVYLCLHMPGTDNIWLTHVNNKVQAAGLSGNVILNPFGNDYATNEQLRNLYRACDIGINTSLGEGWGLISFEHAACGAAQLVPGHTAPAEIWKDAGIVISTSSPVQLTTSPFQMYKLNDKDMTQQMVKLVNDETYLAQVSENCSRHIAGSQFNWDIIARQWKNLFETGN